MFINENPDQFTERNENKEKLIKEVIFSLQNKKTDKEFAPLYTQR